MSGGIKLDKFGGMLPAWDSRLLPEGQADYSLNCYLFSGALNGWRQPKLLIPLKNPTTTRYVYRIPNSTTNDTRIIAPDAFWMEFTDPDTQVMRTPVVDDQFQRYYWASVLDVPRYNTYARILNGDPAWMLGVPGSGCTPGVEVTGGGDTSQFGNVTVLPGAGGSDYRAGNSVFLTPIVPDGTLLINDVSFMPTVSNGGVNFQAVVYSDLNGAPYQLIGTGAIATGVTAGTAATSHFANGISVISNVTYWIGIAVDSPVYVKVADTRVNNGAFFSNTFSNGPPAFASPVGGGAVWNMWADLQGASVFEARAYVYTWVTAYGEEGPPSPPTLVNGWSNATWTVSLFMPTPNNMGVDRNITKTRIYRTISNQSGQAVYYLVAEIPVTQATYADTIADNIVANNTIMPSLYWSGPPSDMKGIVSFPNGIAVGFKSNEVWFSEAYRPHAWPPGYVLTTEFPIVGIGVTGQTVVVCTQGTPYIITGSSPAAMSLLKIGLPEPCLHRGSIVSTDTTVLYVSQNGLVQVSQSGAANNVTEDWITRERWQQLTPSKFVRAVKHATNYFAFGTVSGTDNSVAQQGFTVELSPADAQSFTVWPQPGAHRLGFSQLSAPNLFDINNVELDAWTGVCLLVQNGGIWYYDFTDPAPVIVPYKWRSKVYQQVARQNFAAMKAWFSIPPNTPQQSASRNTNDPQPTLASNQYAIIRVYADNDIDPTGAVKLNLWTTRELRKSGELLRIYSGIKAEAWQFEIEGRVNVSNMQVATTAKELGLL